MKRIITEKAMKAFGAHLKSEEKSEHTVEKYLRDARAFAAFAGDAAVTKETVIRYKTQLLENGYAVRSVNSVLASLNSLFVFVSRLVRLPGENIENSAAGLLPRRKGTFQSRVRTPLPGGAE